METLIKQRVAELRAELESCEDTRITLENALQSTLQRMVEITAGLRELEGLLSSQSLQSQPDPSHQTSVSEPNTEQS